MNDFMTCKLRVKHKKSNVMTGNECRNWKASTFCWSQTVCCCKGYDLVLVSFKCEKRKSHAAIRCAL